MRLRRQIISMATRTHTHIHENKNFCTLLLAILSYLCIDSVILLRLIGRLIFPQSALRLFIIETHKT